MLDASADTTSRLMVAAGYEVVALVVGTLLGVFKAGGARFGAAAAAERPDSGGDQAPTWMCEAHTDGRSAHWSRNLRVAAWTAPAMSPVPGWAVMAA